jgi:formamidopyrimidine-DNA glycosylase
MPEGDTVYRAARSLHRALGGEVLERTDFRVPAYATASLVGQRVLEVVPRGKHMLLRTDAGLTLHTHFRMDGAWYLYRPGDRLGGGPAHEIRLILQTAGWLAVGYRMPVVDLVPTHDEALVVGHLGPDLLAEVFAFDQALDRLRAQPLRAVGEALLDQRNLAGIGNVYKNEVLFLERVDPWTPVGELACLEAIVARVERLMRGNLEHSMRSTTGLRGRADRYWVQEREGLGCRRCRTPICRAEQGTDPTQARQTWWCPRCQPGPYAPPVRLASGRPPRGGC